MFTKPHRNIFSDRSSLVLRAMLRKPERTWSVRDFLKEGVSIGLANQTLNRMEDQGYVVRERHGRNSSSRLVQKDKLLKDWVQAYSLDLNHSELLHFAGINFNASFANFMRKQNIPYAYTGFSASRLISSYVLDDRHYIYADASPEKFKELLDSLQNHLGLLKLARGGNVWLAVPYYQSSVFKDAQTLRGVPAVSHLQIFLDLMKLPAGVEEVDHLKQHFKKKGGTFV